MQIPVHFYSYFKDLAGCENTIQEVPPNSTLGDLHDRLAREFPRLESMRKSTLIAVGLDYQTRDYILRDGDEVSLFPPVQGG